MFLAVLQSSLLIRSQLTDRSLWHSVSYVSNHSHLRYLLSEPRMSDGAGLLLVAKIVVVVVYTSVFLPPALLIVGFGIWLGRVYIKAQLSVKREMSNSRAPVLATFGSAIQGLSTCGEIDTTDVYI